MIRNLTVAAASIALLFSIGCGTEENTVVEAPADWQPTDVDDMSYMEDMNAGMDPNAAEE